MSPALQRIGAIVVKEFRHLLRDPRILIAVLLLPVVELALVAYAISFDVKNLPTTVVDQDNTVASRDYVQAFRASELFDVRRTAQDLDEVNDLFLTGKTQVAVIVPPGFERSLARGEAAQVSVLIDGSQAASAKVGEAYARVLNAQYSGQVTTTWLNQQGQILPGGELEPRMRTWFNPERKSNLFLIPGIMVVIIMMVTIQQTATSLVRERDLHTAEQMGVSPLRTGELIIGKLLPWTFLAFVELLIIVAVGIGVFGVPLRGDLLVLVASATVFIFACLALGLIVSAISPSMETATALALMLAFLPAFLLSGFAFPLDATPIWLQWISHLFPGRFMVTIVHGVFLKGSGWAEFWVPFAQLCVYAVLAFALATLLSRRRAA